MKHLGQTRSAFQQDHLLQTPDTFVRTPLPGMEHAAAIIHCGPAMGAKFSEYTAEMESGGMLGPAYGQRFAYLIRGTAAIEIDGTEHTMAPGDFAYMPEGHPHRITARSEAQFAIVEKRYVPVAGFPAPQPLVSSESSVSAQPLMGDDALQVRSLLPPDFAFDFAVNTMTFDPGASLSMVEIH